MSRAVELLDEYVLTAQRAGLPVLHRAYRVADGSVAILFSRGRLAAVYKLAVRGGLEGEEVYSLTRSGLEYLDYARLYPDGRLEWGDPAELPGFLSVTAELFSVHEGDVWSDRVAAWHGGRLIEAENPSAVEAARRAIPCIEESELRVYERPGVMDYAVAVGEPPRGAVVAWYSGLTGTLGGLLVEAREWGRLGEAASRLGLECPAEEPG